MWAGQKAKRHPMHRYGGLCFLILYGLAWVEYISNYHDDVSADTLLPHVVGLNGMLKSGAFTNTANKYKNVVSGKDKKDLADLSFVLSFLYGGD